eukprot:TRINITY_DN4551_c0_g1_i5.p1 TRINITY_DN4551_c0_g1~~TRINITY_DN4551_c0_g1_i5.p1  ORF type:complete len:450 (-),score=92.03 TRINITY_DN4551_c0_g1_i5:1172-2521(-)
MSTDKVHMWESQYASGDTSWHLDTVNDKLIKHMGELVGNARNGEVLHRTILVPLCGRTKDMIHLYNQGHTVVGCEWVDSVCAQFFTENNIPFTRSQLEGVEGSLYQSEDGRMRIFQCDFLLLSPELVRTKFDSVLDVQSLSSINPRDRKQYVRAVRSLLQDEFRYLLVTIEYEPFAHRGRPHSISYNAVKELFGSFSNLKFVAQLPAAPPLKPNWKENVFSMISGTEDRVQYWQARWATGQSQWHSQEPHKFLVKYLDDLKNGQDKIRIFLPMCGKAGDLMWLYNQGHTVVGVEGVPFVVEQFFRENNLEHDKTSLEADNINGWRYRSKDGRLTIFACDFFLVTPGMVGPVDAVYDRGALEAINIPDRIPYVQIMKSLLGKDFRYILNGYEYDDNVFQGPPRHLPRDQVFNLFNCKVSILEEADYSWYGQEKYNYQGPMIKVIYKLTPD